MYKKRLLTTFDGDEESLSYYKEKVKLYPICQLNTMM